ncbi:MAG TPA: hypothetical protein VNH41_04975 [Steroidobacteraceae bacterium]|nr:hypothetical protein [Steroidobacteraceae bacterium]
MRLALFFCVLLVAGCGGGGGDAPGTELDGALCTAPITVQDGDYTIDQDGQWLYLADTGDEVRILYPCSEVAS